MHYHSISAPFGFVTSETQAEKKQRELKERKYSSIMAIFSSPEKLKEAGVIKLYIGDTMYKEGIGQRPNLKLLLYLSRTKYDIN